uniref:L-aminoadipate-semialdehyde dehydrogenase-phosphopantetheinyl transferase n=1 Tax=Globodera rostochiensis TaxID=31243 RepID=A0A914GYL1_GLORO
MHSAAVQYSVSLFIFANLSGSWLLFDILPLHLRRFVFIRRAAMQAANEQCFCKRWAFSLQKSMENENFERHFRLAVQSITPDDYEKAVQCLCGVGWADVEVSRTERGKPFIVRPEDLSVGLNVSHQGDYTVFASSCTNQVGVDVMRLDMCRGNKTANEYINSMAKSASARELRTMRSQPTEQMKMTVFYRYWCLKEAIMKATGHGLVNDLSRYDFIIDPSERYRQGCFITSTTFTEDAKLQPQWIFEESFVDANHVAAVCREKALPAACTFNKDPCAKIFFSKVDFDFLLGDASLLNPLPDGAASEYNNFMEKPRKKF